MSTDETPPPDEARPDEIEFALEWRPDGATGLAGDLVARNVSGRTWRISGKPGLALTADDGHDLDTHHIVTLEFRMPGHAVVLPGGSARASVRLTGWDGMPLGDRIGVEWGGHRADVRTTGPRQPTSSGGDLETTSSWFVAD